MSLEKYGLSPMSQNEQLNSSGGSILKWVAGAIGLTEAPIIAGILIVVGAIDGAYSFGKGVVKGWNTYR